MPVPIVILESLRDQYYQDGINVQLMPKDSEEAIAGKAVIKVEGRNIDLVHVTFASGSMHVSKGTKIGLPIEKSKKTSKPNLRFHHIIRGLGGRTKEDLKTELKAEKKGMVRRKLVDVRWEGALAEMLNSDFALKSKLLRTETDNVKIEPDEKNDCIRITMQKGIDLISESKGMLIKKTEMRAEKLPSLETFEAMDIIAGHIKSS
jgi:hypothetical protein